MTSSINAIDFSTHKDVHVNPQNNFKHAQHMHIVPAYISEFVAMSGNYPVVFVKDGQTGQFKSAAIMGLEEGKNVIFGENYANASYIPMLVRRYPYTMLTSDSEESFGLAIDHDSPWVNTDGKGYALFQDNGQPSEELQQVAGFFADSVKHEELTEQFIAFLNENELLCEADLKVSLGADNRKQLNGVYQIDIEKLKNLDDEVIIQLHKNNYNPAIYAHLASLHQLQKLVNLSARQQG